MLPSYLIDLLPDFPTQVFTELIQALLVEREVELDAAAFVVTCRSVTGAVKNPPREQAFESSPLSKWNLVGAVTFCANR